MKRLFRFNHVGTVGAFSMLVMASGVFAAEVDPTKPAVAVLGANKAIFKRANGKTAIISGKSYRQGDTVGEFTILKINAKDVVISDGREQRTLELYTYEIKK
jgi:MSHA biogenesis protein MshK